jgi:hypothetical protein
MTRRRRSPSQVVAGSRGAAQSGIAARSGDAAPSQGLSPSADFAHRGGRWPSAAVAALAVAFLAAGCGSAPEAPSKAEAPAAGRAVVVGAAPVAPAAATPDAEAAPATARQAVARFAKAYINWDAGTIVGNRERLARSATGDAAASMAQAAERSRGDYELQAGRISNRGDVIAVSPQDGGEAGSWVVVTRERMGAPGTYGGLPPTYHVTIATVEAVGDGWAVSHWAPQS